MQISDPRDIFFYPHHTPMKDTYILAYQIKIIMYFTCMINSYLTQNWIKVVFIQSSSDIGSLGQRSNENCQMMSQYATLAVSIKHCMSLLLKVPDSFKIK